MGRHFILDFDEIQPSDCIYCRMCRVRVAFVEDYIGFLNDLMPEGIFNKMFNVQVPKDERYHHVRDGETLADTYCVGCGMLLGWKLIAVTQPCRFSKEGRFAMKLDNLSYWDDELLYKQDPNDQDGVAYEQVPNEQDLGSNEEVADQDGDANEQDLGANEQNADQDGGANEQDGGGNVQVPNEQNGGVNEQVPNQDEDIAGGMGNIDQSRSI
ncbi:unnamed protein product [Withania somnifera]